MLLTQLPPNQVSRAATLIVTQSDGRTMFAIGTDISGAPPPFTVPLAGIFSDRTNPRVSLPNVFGPQPFSIVDNNIDQLTLTVPSNNAPLKILVKLLRWNSQFNLTLDARADLRAYLGLGPTIGNAQGQALYFLTFN